MDNTITRVIVHKHHWDWDIPCVRRYETVCDAGTAETNDTYEGRDAKESTVTKRDN